MDRGAWKAAVHGVAEGQTRLSDFTFTFCFHALDLMIQVLLLPIRLRQVKQLAQVHTAKNKWDSQGANPDPHGTTTWPLNYLFLV